MGEDLTLRNVVRCVHSHRPLACFQSNSIPDQWFPWMWKFGWSELHVLRVLYGLLPVFVVDTILYIISMFWAYWHGVPEWAPPSRKLMGNQTYACHQLFFPVPDIF